VLIWLLLISVSVGFQVRLNELMESKGGKKKSSSSKSLLYEAPLGYSIEDIRPAGGIKKFRSAAYSNVSFMLLDVNDSWFFAHELFADLTLSCVLYVQCARKPS